MAHYEVWLGQPNSTRIKLLTPSRIEYVHVVGDVGAFSIVIPFVDAELFKELPDRRIEIMRRSGNARIYREFYGFIEAWQPTLDSNGKPALLVSGTDAAGFLDRRVVVTSAGSLYKTIGKSVDDAMKEFVTDNLISATDTDRNLNIFTVDPNLSDGPAIERVYNNTNLLSALQDMQAYSKEQGQEVFFGMRPNGSNWVFETKINQYGEDRTATGRAPLIFGDKWRNVTNQSRDTSYASALSNVYALGSGLEDNQEVQEVESSTVRNASPFSRREGTTYASNDDTTTALQDAGEAALSMARPYRRFSCDLIDAPSTPYGIIGGWRAGTKVTIEMFGERQDAMIKSVRAIVDEFGREVIRGNVEYER